MNKSQIRIIKSKNEIGHLHKFMKSKLRYWRIGLVFEDYTVDIFITHNFDNIKVILL